MLLVGEDGPGDPLGEPGAAGLGQDPDVGPQELSPQADERCRIGHGVLRGSLRSGFSTVRITPEGVNHLTESLRPLFSTNYRGFSAFGFLSGLSSVRSTDVAFWSFIEGMIAGWSVHVTSTRG